MRTDKAHSEHVETADAVDHAPVDRPVVLVGLMGAGKTTVGRRLAARLGLPFVDADAEIEKAAGRSISEIFEDFGEKEFRKGERRVIARLLRGKPIVLATGGGAYMDPKTRDRIRRLAISVWLKADVKLLAKRTAKRDTRPLLRTGDPLKILEKLAAERYPVYAEADVTVESGGGPHEQVVARILDALKERPNRNGSNRNETTQNETAQNDTNRKEKSDDRERP